MNVQIVLTKLASFSYLIFTSDPIMEQRSNILKIEYEFGCVNFQTISIIIILIGGFKKKRVAFKRNVLKNYSQVYANEYL